MLISSMISQGEGGGFDIFWLILPLLCCVMAMSQSRGERRPESGAVTESWFTTQNIETTYEAIETETAGWRREAEERKKEPTSFTSRLMGAFRRQKLEARFVVQEEVPSRLYRLADPTGPIYFELTEVEGGGTVVKTTYHPVLKRRMAKFKAGLPLKIPSAPIGNRCPSCGKPAFPEFILCPYCGEKMVRE